MGEEGPKGDPGEKVSLNLYTNLKAYNMINYNIIKWYVSVDCDIVKLLLIGHNFCTVDCEIIFILIIQL